MVQSKADREKQKLIHDKCQSLIEVLLKDEDNKYCVDCDAKGPRWASWNLGVFLCIRCAGIHRNLGVHISKVKSVNLDSWKPENVAYVQRMGNSRARAIYEANLPDDFRRPQTDTSLESFIRAKYEHKKYIAHDYVDPGPPPPAFDVDEELKAMKEQKKSKTVAPARTVPMPELKSTPKPRPQTDVTTAKIQTPTATSNVRPNKPSDDLLDLASFATPEETIVSNTANDPFASFGTTNLIPSLGGNINIGNTAASSFDFGATSGLMGTSLVATNNSAPTNSNSSASNGNKSALDLLIDFDIPGPTTQTISPQRTKLNETTTMWP